MKHKNSMCLTLCGEIYMLNLDWRKRSIPTHSGWLYPLTFDAEKGLKEA